MALGGTEIRLSGRHPTALAVSSAVVLTACFPPVSWTALGFVALVPLGLAVATGPCVDKSLEAARLGGIFGTVHFALLLHWVLLALVWASPWASVGFVAMLAALAAWSAGLGFVLHRLHRGLGLPMWAALPLVWTAADWLRGHLGDLSFPWLGLGTALAAIPELAGAAELVGERGLTLWLAGINGLVCSMLLARSRASTVRLALVLMVAVTLPAAWGLGRSDVEPGGTVRVAVLQPNIDQGSRRDAQGTVEATLATARDLMASLATSRVDLVIWPEGSIPVALEESPTVVARLRSLSRRAKAPILLGTYGAGPSGGVQNSARLVDSTGVRPYRYDKHRLVPVIERVPFADWLGGRSTFGNGMEPGTAWSTFAAGGTPFGAFICFESAFEDVSRSLRAAGASVLVNLSNDGWYGRPGPFGRTIGLAQHPAHLVMRAVEHRTGVVRAANTGPSIIVGPSGRVLATTSLLTTELLVADVPLARDLTAYARAGDVVGPICAAGVLVLLLVLAARRVEAVPSFG
jgi:apolipoprotein N-acyltransferase